MSTYQGGGLHSPLRGERGPSAPGISHPVKLRGDKRSRRRAPRVISCCVDGDTAAPLPCPWHDVVCGQEWERCRRVDFAAVLAVVATVVLVAVFVWTLVGGGRVLP